MKCYIYDLMELRYGKFEQIKIFDEEKKAFNHFKDYKLKISKGVAMPGQARVYLPAPETLYSGIKR